jgi:hypothetical protein
VVFLCPNNPDSSLFERGEDGAQKEQPSNRMACVFAKI